MTLQDLLGIELPIIQAPMAGVQAGAMAIAVSNAGGLGSLPSALLSPSALHDELRLITAQTRKPYNVNFFCHSVPARDRRKERAWRELLAPYFEELGVDPESVADGPVRAPFSSEVADIVEELRPPVVSFHFGLPSDELLRRVRGWSSTILASATTVEEALWLEERGVDVIIAQGAEAGGHRGMFLTDDVATQMGTFALVPQVVRAVRRPVIAAGGIADGAGIRAALALGAAGVQIGTAYLLCPEATTRPVHRAALKSDAARVTAITNVFSGRPARGIVNRIMRELGYVSEAAPPFPFASAALAPLRVAAEKHSSGDFSPLWSGQNAVGCRETPAAALTRDLANAI
jgi:nitronate monooxygenase